MIKGGKMDSNIVKSTGRAFAIFEAFEQHRRPVSLGEIASELQYPKSSAAALLKSMVSIGYLSYARSTRTYFPTTRINTLGRWIPQQLAADGIDLRLMHKLRDTTGAAVVLGGQSDFYIQYLHVLDTTPPCVSARVGTLRFLTSSGTGIALLSHATSAEVTRIVRATNHSLVRQRRPLLDVSSLMPIIRRTRRYGYVLMPAGSSGHGSIAFPLPATQQGRRFAIGVIVSSDRLEATAKVVIGMLATMNPLSIRSP